MALFSITPPETFTFSQPDNWPQWIHRFERFRQASGLQAKSQESQINTLVYTMGDQADDIFLYFNYPTKTKKVRLSFGNVPRSLHEMKERHLQADEI